MRRTSLASNRGRCLWLLAAIAVAAGPIGWPWAGPDGPSGLAANAAQPEQKSMAEQMRTVSPDELAEFKRLAAESARQATTRPARGTTTQPAVLTSPSTQPAAIRPTTRPAVAVSTTQPAAVTAAPQRPQRPFNFNWKDRAWADVIDDFSRMSGRSIIGDSPPAGTVTFRSSRMMSYKEALDVLNVLLFEHNYHLAPVGKFLLLKRLPELGRRVPQENFFDSEEAFRSAKVDDGAFVRVLYTPRSGVASELISRARGVVPDYCLIGAVEGANMISITCMARDARKFLDYVHRFERKLPDVRQQRVFKLRYARAREVLTVLQQLVDFGAGGVMRRGRRGRRVAPAEPAAVPVSAAVQEELNWLIVKATPEKLEQIARIIEQIDVEAAAGAVEPEVYKLKHARAEELAGLIGQIVGAKAGPVRARGKRVPVVRPGMATVVAEPRTNSLLVLASQPERKRIAQLIERFDVPLGTERFKRVALQHSRADQMVETLKTLLSAGQVRSRKGPATGPQVAVDPAGNAVLVAGEPEQVNRVLEMIGQLDQKSDVSAMEHIVQLDSARPSALAKVLSQLYDGAAGRRGRASAARSIRFIPFDESNTLVVTAPQKDWQRIESLIQDLDRRSEQIGPAVRTWQMKHADATKVANTLRQMLAAGRRGRAPAAAMVAADERTNTVMARCDRDAGQQIEALIKLLDVPAEQAEPRLIELKYADAGELANVLNQMFAGARGKGTTPRQVQIVAAAGGLLVKAPPQVQERIKQMIAALDRPGLVEVEVKTYQLRHAQAAQISKTVQSALQARARPQRVQATRGRRRWRGPSPVQVNADPRTNQLVVAAPKSLMAFAEELIAKLDAEDVAEARLVRIVELANADASELVRVASQAMGLGRKGRAGAALTITADPSGQRVVLSGLAAEVQRAEQLIQRLDAQAEPTRTQLRTFELQEADAAEVAKTIQSLFAGPAKAGKRGAGMPTVAADARTNTLFVSASARQLQRIEPLVAMLDKPGTPGLPMHFISLKSRDAEAVAERVQRMAESRWPKQTPSIEADMFFPSLIVIASDEQFEQIKQMVELVDRESPRDLLPVTATYEPTRASPAELADILRQYAELYGYRVTVKTVGKEAGQAEPWRGLVEEVKPGQRGRVHPCVLPIRLAALGRTLDALLAQTTQPAGQKGTPTSQPTTSEAQAEAPALPEVTITIDERGRLILRGPQQAIDDLESVIQTIEESFPEKPDRMEVRVYRLRHIDATAAAQIIHRMFNEPARRVVQPKKKAQPKSEQKAKSEKRPAQARAQAAKAVRVQPGRERVRVLPDLRNNWLIIRALPEDFEPVLKLLATIDVEPELRYDIRVIRLKHLDAQQVEQALKAVLRIDRRRPGARRAAPKGQPQAVQQLQEQLLQLQQAAGVASASIGSTDLITITSDPTINALIVSAPEPAMKLITGFIDKLEQEKPQSTVVQTIALQHARADQIVAALEKVFIAGRVARRGKKAGAPSRLELGPVAFAADTRTNSVIVRAYERDLPLVQDLIKRLDAEGEGSQVELFVLRSADATTMARALQETYAGGRGRRPGAGDVRIAADPGTNTLLVWAPKSLRQQIGQDIRMMDQQSGQRVIRQIPVVNADAESLARTLQDVFGGRRRGRGRRGGGAQDVQITGNSAAKTILVSAPQELFDQIEQLIRSMDVAGAAPLAVRVFHLQHARASEVLAKMQEMTRQVLQQVRATRRGMNLDIFAATADDRTNSLVVTGGELTFAIVEQVLKELDKEAAAPRMPALHTVQLSKSNARDVARAINNLFRGRRSRSPGEQPPRAEHDESTNTVLVYATAEEFKEIKEKIIDKLEEFQTPQAELKQYQIPLQYARAEEVAQTLSRYFRDRTAQARAAGVRGIKPSEVVTIVPDVTGNTLLVQCNEKNKAEIDQLLAKMDVESVKARGRSIKVFTLQYADPNAVANAIRSAFRQPGRARQSEADRVDAQPEWGTQSVVVSANEENMAKIEQMIAQLDVEATATKQITRIVKLEHAQARDVAEVLTRNLGQTRRRLRTGQMPVAVVANEPTNSLVVTASQTELPEIEQLIKTLDVPPDVQKDRIIKAIKLTYADPYAMANAIRNAFRPRGVRPRPEDIVVASGEWGTNSVLVSATRDKFEQIEKLVAEMDQEGAGAQVTKVISVNNADAQDVAQSLMSIFIWQGQRTRRGQAPVRIQHLRGTNKILVSGSARQIEEIEQVVQTLDEAATAGQPEMRVIRLSYLAPSEAEQILTDYLRKSGARGRRGGEELAGNVRITASQTMGALIVSGSKEQLDRIEGLIGRLDQPVEEAGTAPRVIPLQTARASQLAETLTRIFTEPARQRARGRRATAEMVPVIVADELTNSLIVRAGSSDFLQIRKMAEQLDTQEAAGLAGVKVIQVAEGIDVRNLAQEIERTINRGEQHRARKMHTTPALVSIGVDERANALIVSGATEQFAEVEKLVRKLEQLKPTGPLRIRIITLQNIDADSVQRVLDQMLERQSQPSRRRPRGWRGRRGQLPPWMERFGTPVLAMGGQTAASRWLMLTMLGQAEAQAQLAPTTQPADEIRGEVKYSVLDERSIILQGDEHDLAILEGIIRALDTAAPRPELRVFTLENAQAAEIAPRLQNMYQRLLRVPGRRPRPEDAVSIVPVPSSNSLIVSAVAERMSEIEVLVKQLDAKPLLGRVTFRTYRLKHIRAGEAKTALESLLQKLRAKRGAKVEQITIEADDRTNSLIVTAAESDLAQVEQFIKTIDVEPAFATAEMLVIGLINAEAEPLAKVINEMLTTAGRGARQLAEQIRRLRLRAREGDRLKELPELDLEKPIKVIAEPGTNSLIVSSHADNLKAMEKVVELLDRVPVWHEVRIRIFMLEHADATELAEMLRNVFEQGQTLPGKPGQLKQAIAAVPKSLTGQALAYKVGIAADPRTNALVVSGREESLALAETLVAKLDRPGMALKFPIKLLRLEHADAQRVAQIMQQIMDRRLEALQKLGKATLERERVFITADVRSNMLVISAKQDNYEEIAALAKKLDSAPQALVDQIRIINLEKTQANVLKPKIEALWKRRAALRRAGAGLPEDQPVVEADERSNSLLIAANPEDFELIRRLVEQLEAQELAPIAEIRLIPLEHNDASLVAPMIKRLFEERKKMRLVPGQQPLPSDNVAVEFDQATNSLIVAASRENYEAMVELVRKIDIELPVGGVVQFFHLKYADVNRVAETIRNLFKEGLWKPGILGVETEISKAREKVAIEVDERSNTLIVSASRENFAIIRTLVEQMDTEEDFLVGNLQLFSLRYADAVKMASLLQELFDKVQSARKSVRQTVELPMTIIPEQSTNTLIIAGSRDGLARAATLIEKFDRRAGPPTSEFRVYQLQQADAVRIGPMIEQLFKERAPKDQRATPFLIQADAGSNSLVVSASREDHDLVASLVAMLDRPSTTAEQVRIFPLRKANAEDLRKTLDDLYNKRRGKGQEQTIAFGVDARTNSLIVSGGPGELADIERLVSRLDTTEPIDEQTVRIFRLKRAQAEKMAEILGQIMQGKAGDGGGTESKSVLISFVDVDEAGVERVRKLVREKVQITPDIRTNSLIVMAPPDGMTMLGHLIEKLDSIAPQLVEVRVFPLRNADASETVQTLEKLFQTGKEAGAKDQEERRLMLGRGGALLAAASIEGVSVGGRELLAFTADVRTNSVIAVGTPEYLLLVEQLIQELDSESVEQRINRVITLKNAEVETVEAALRSFIDSELKRLSELGEEAALRRMEREVSVVAHKETNQLMLSVSPRYESQIMQLVNELDQPPPQVMIQALLVEITLSNRLEMGLEFAIQDLLFSETAVAGRNNTLQSNNFDVVVGTDLGAAGSGLGGFSFTITGEDFSFLLRALQSESQVEVLSSPRILAMDNKEAEINIGQDVPFVRGVEFLETGQTRTQIEYENVGIILRVTPHINPDGFVIMEVEPEISSITSSTVPISEGVVAPIFNRNFVKTTITVKDGETAVIGGLITTNRDESENKVPILGDIPILGALFRATVRGDTKTELLIVLTPRVIRTVEDLRRQSVTERDKIDLLPETVRTSPLMEELQVQPERPGAVGEPQPSPGKPPERAPTRYELPEVQTYGPPKPLLVEMSADPKDASSADRAGRHDYEYYRRQRY